MRWYADREYWKQLGIPIVLSFTVLPLGMYLMFWVLGLLK